MSRWDVYRDEAGRPVTVTQGDCAARTFTEQQRSAIRHALDVWAEVCIDTGYTTVAPREIAVRKSALLGRMLYQGLPPLDDPPPRAYSAPWHALIEDGRAVLADASLFAWTNDASGMAGLAICQDPGWTYDGQPLGFVARGDIIEHLPLSVRHERAPGEWTIRLATAVEAAGEAWWTASADHVTVTLDGAARIVAGTHPDGEAWTTTDWLTVLERVR